MWMAPSQSVRSKNLPLRLRTTATQTAQMTAQLTMSTMIIPQTRAMARRMVPTMNAMMIMVEVAGTVIRVAVRIYQTGTRPRQTNDPVCLGDILYRIGYGSQSQIL